ncbi:MAG TPA: nicotinate-nucleotide adenylyltransferase [Candidatus Eisenbacteria bacterium]|jgi:nicotinate-nucleotide adenylyltransferase
MERIGLFGGTFDPPHLGHLTLAEWARERLALDRVVFIPAGRPPHKRGGRISSAAARLAMTRLAVRSNPGFRVSTVELEPGGPSFTVDTLRWFAVRAPGSRLYLLIGADSLDDLRRWHEPDQILKLAALAVAGRPGVGRRSRTWLRGRRVVWLGNPGLEVSSSLARQRARAGRSLRYLVPDAVAAFIERQGLYRRRR